MNYQKNEIIFKVENVNLKYERPILRDINFEIQNIVRPDVHQGQVVSLIGRSGIGKTQLFKILGGLIKANTGSVKVGLDLHDVRTGEIAIVPQNYILFNHRTIKENLELGMLNCAAQYDKKTKEEMIIDYAHKFDLKEHLQKYPMQLSGGQRQRVSIIQQILTGNRFILLDEPFSGLDSIVKDKVLNLLLSISLLNELNTLIIVSHDIENSLAISDTAFILANEVNKEGSTITEKIDLAAMGICWKENIKEEKEFKDLVAQMKYKI